MLLGVHGPGYSCASDHVATCNHGGAYALWHGQCGHYYLVASPYWPRIELKNGCVHLVQVSTGWLDFFFFWGGGSNLFDFFFCFCIQFDV